MIPLVWILANNFFSVKLYAQVMIFHFTLPFHDYNSDISVVTKNYMIFDDEHNP